MTGTETQPLRVAIIGSGPSGFYAADALLKNKNDLIVEVDMYDRLPTPHGLVRGGVAPDHQKIKNVTKVYDRIADNPRFRFYGNVEFGTDITHEDITRLYHQVIYATGAQTDRQLGIDGEDLPGSHAATEFVAWYNAHPDYRHLEFDLSSDTAIVVGNGNVAMDVTRILASSPAELARTDIADYALEALRNSNIRRIIMLGRRGPAQAKFTNPEIKEMGELEDAQVIVGPDEIALDPLSEEFILSGEDKNAEKNVQILRQYAKADEDPNKSKRIITRFLVSPVKIEGNGKVESVTIVKNELYKNERGVMRPRSTDQHEDIPAGLIFRSIGYHGVPLPDVPFFEKWGIIPNDGGRVQMEHEGEVVTGEYVVGWIKRGPSGIIGTNKPDSQATVANMLADAEAGDLLSPESPTAEAVENLLTERNVRFVRYADWQILDKIEVERGEEQGRPRVKFSDPDEMLRVIDENREPISGD